MKIVVLGAGALGCALGSVLTEGGHEVWLVNRGQAHVDAMNARGLQVREHGVDRFVSVHAATTCAEVDLGTGSVDLIVVLVKSFHTREAIASAQPILNKDTVVLSLQNGLGHEDILAEVVGNGRVLAGKTYAGGVMIGVGHIVAGTQGKDTHIGELNGQVTHCRGIQPSWLVDPCERKHHGHHVGQTVGQCGHRRIEWHHSIDLR
jgi:2-dehydropantoate 2-reductase